MAAKQRRSRLGGMEMTRLTASRNSFLGDGMTALSVFALVEDVALADQNRCTQTAPNGIAFSEFKGYDQWQNVAVSTTDTGIKAILGNPAMIKAYRKAS
jgi:hypothetical protein